MFRLASLTIVLGFDSQIAYVAFATGGGIAVASLVLWLALGHGPRRARAYRHARQLLAAGSWEPALAIAVTLQERGRHPQRWHEMLRILVAECHRTAAEDALREKRFESGLDHALKSASLLGEGPEQARAHVIDKMLGEARALLGANSKADADTVLAFISRIFPIQLPCPEGSFWQAICYLKKGMSTEAIESLREARAAEQPHGAELGGEESTGRRTPVAHIDPPLYLGAVLLREGRPEESLRYLAEANRLDSSCPFVTWQLGMAILRSGGDSLVAVKALQRAVGSRGLEMWKNCSPRAWIEAFPERGSFVRRLASRHGFKCPLFGADVPCMIREGLIALGDGHYRLGNFEEAARIFNQLLQEGAPSLPILRGLGLALARLERFDQAFRHLRAGYEMEEPKDALTACYLALCGAMGKPTRPEDREKNVRWALHLVTRLPFQKSAEWAKILKQLFAQARSLGLPIPLEDQSRLCEVLVAVDAADPLAAAAYAQLAALTPDPSPRMGEGGKPSLGRECAWLYCRACLQHEIECPGDLDLFALTLATQAEARVFFGERGWDFDEVEMLYLERCAKHRPGAFPAVLGPDFPDRGASLLLARSGRLETLGDMAGALASAEVLLKLAPRCAAAHDRISYLAYHTGDFQRSIAMLEAWHQLAPDNPLPLVRSAIIEQKRDNSAGQARAIRKALAIARGKQRAEIAFLGARLSLQAWLKPTPEHEPSAGRNGASRAGSVPTRQELVHEAVELLEQCLRENPEHEGALWCKTAIAFRLGQIEPALPRPGRDCKGDGAEAADPRLHFMTAVSHLAAGEYQRVPSAVRRAVQGRSDFAPDGHYVAGRAAFLEGNLVQAEKELRQVTEGRDYPCRDHARAVIGAICLSQGRYEEAIVCWNSVAPAKREAWGIHLALRGSLVVAALESFHAGRFEDAAERLGEAGRLGSCYRGLGALRAAALLKAGQRLLYS